MVNWVDHGEILRASQVPFGRPEGGFMWAPDCAYKNGTYYFYFPHPSGTDWNSTWKIGVATSTSPASGFTVQGYIQGLESLIDPCVFVDDDGQAYFYYGGGGICKGGRMKANMMEIDGAMQTMQGLVDFHEATWVHKKNGVYYLSYSDNNAVGGVIKCDTQPVIGVVKIYSKCYHWRIICFAGESSFSLQRKVIACRNGWRYHRYGRNTQYSRMANLSNCKCNYR
jgi:beta-xylosidase